MHPLPLTIIIPTLNEAGNIDQLLESLTKELSREELSAQILVVDGGSTDGTQDKVQSWHSKASVRLLESDGKRGLAGDVLFGASEAKSDVLLVMDADLSHPSEKVPELVRHVLSGDYDMVIGSRYVKGGEIIGWPWRRKFVSRVATILTRFITKIRDPLAGFFAIRRDHLLKVDPKACGFKIGLEALVAGGKKMRVLEIPITFQDRVQGKSKMGIRQIFLFLQRWCALAMKRS